MAETIIVPEDKEIPIKDNYTITIITDTNLLNKYKAKFIYELKPKQGKWAYPFLAYPIEEDSMVKGRFLPQETGSYILCNPYGEAVSRSKKINNKLINFAFFSIGNLIATHQEGPLFICNQKPTWLLFGDTKNSQNTYYIELF